jgi:hypothetical protein
VRRGMRRRRGWPSVHSSNSSRVGAERLRDTMRRPFGWTGYAPTSAAEMPVHAEGLQITAGVGVTYQLTNA